MNESQTFGVQEQAFHSGLVGTAVESRVAVVVTAAGGDGKISRHFPCHAACAGGDLCYATAEFQPAVAGSGANIKLSVCSLLKIDMSQR